MATCSGKISLLLTRSLWNLFQHTLKNINQSLRQTSRHFILRTDSLDMMTLPRGCPLLKYSLNSSMISRDIRTLSQMLKRPVKQNKIIVTINLSRTLFMGKGETFFILFDTCPQVTNRLPALCQLIKNVKLKVTLDLHGNKFTCALF